MTHHTVRRSLLALSGMSLGLGGVAQALPTAGSTFTDAEANVFLLAMQAETTLPDDKLPEAMEAALQAVAAGSADPIAKREELITKLMGSNRCYSKEMSQAQWQHALNNLELLPPGMFNEPGGPRFFVANTVWTGNGSQASSGRAMPANLTVSFPNDGISWDGASNVLDARLGAQFGAANKDRGREYIRQSLANWRSYSGLRYTEVADDNIGFTNATAHSNLRGDIRIGARGIDGPSGILAYNNFPTQGGDMVLDADEFVSGNFGNTSNNLRTFRNTLTHEHGHGTGYIHSVPCNNTKLMEPQLSVSFDMLAIDERRGAQRNYGDRFAGNNAVGNARNFGDLTSPILKSIIEKNLSTNGVTGFNNSDEDWFRFTIGSAQDVVITVDPTGGTYLNDDQVNGCSGGTTSVVAEQAGNLNIELRDSVGTTLFMSAAAGAAGVTEVLTAAALAPGTYTVRIQDVGPNPNQNQVVQLYDLTIRVGTAKAPPTASAGINKRILAGQLCYFMGNVNSRPNDAGASISQYSWDLDGDGTFEVANSPVPTRTYTANGTVNVTLRVTDNFGSTSTDTITVTVFGATCPLTIDTQPVAITRCTGQSATFTTSATSTGTVSYQWRRNMVNIAGATNPSITINPVTTGDAGNYDCVVSSSCVATQTTSAVGLTVTQSVAIITQPVTQTVAEGSTVVLTVAANGAAPITYQWKRNNVNVPGATGPSLLMINATPAQSGNYFCAVTNSCGTVNSDVAVVTIESKNTCVCDWNGDTVLNSQDFFNFVTEFFGDNADFNDDGVTNSQDFFDFLACFFTGC
ncbi:MAG: immunoglobulin domain-containing protein [Pyrinomonadaceae bacterium]|nr:immunoglobulin domain-containing protein [Phycisphaerales bacterium]